MSGTVEMAEANRAIRDAVEARVGVQTAVAPRSVRATLPEPPPGVRAESEAFLAVLREVWEMHLAKTADYGSDEDALANVRNGADVVNIEPWRACLVRIADKVTRLRTFCRTGRLVHEGVADTLLDLCAYAAIGLVLYRDGDEPRGRA